MTKFKSIVALVFSLYLSEACFAASMSKSTYESQFLPAFTIGFCEIEKLYETCFSLTRSSCESDVKALSPKCFKPENDSIAYKDFEDVGERVGLCIADLAIEKNRKLASALPNSNKELCLDLLSKSEAK